MEEAEEAVEMYELGLAEGKEQYYDTRIFIQIILGYLFKEKFAEADKVMQSAKKQHPDTLVLFVFEGMILFELRRFDEAIEVLNTAALHQPTDYMIYTVRANCYFQIQEPELARADNRKAEEYGYDISEMYEFEGKELVTSVKQKVKEMEPLAYFNEIRQDYSSEYEALDSVLKVYEFNIGIEIPEALNFFGKLVEDNPSSVVRWMFFGNINRIQGKYAEATEAFDFAISLDPENAIIYHEKARFASMNCDYEEAVNAYYMSIKYAKPTDEEFFTQHEGEEKHDNINTTYYWIGFCYMQSKEYKKAEEVYRIHNVINHETTDSQGCIGDALMKLKEFKEAVPYYEKMNEIDGNDEPYILDRLGYAYYKAGDITKAQETFDKIDKDGFLAEEYYCFYPQFLWDMGEEKKAMEVINEGVFRYPVIASLFYVKAALYYQMDDNINGNKLLNTALKLGFNDYDL